MKRTGPKPASGKATRIGITGVNGEAVSPAERRSRILEVSAHLFREKGFEQTRLEDVANTLGVTRATFYYYFKSKQEILEAIYEIAVSVAEDVVKILDSDLPPTARFRTMITGLAELMGGSAVNSVFHRELHGLSPRYARRLTQRRDVIDRRVINFLEECRREHAWQVSDPRVTTYTILGAVNWMHVWFDPGGSLSPSEVGELIADQLLIGLCPGPGREAAASTRRARSPASE